MPWIRGPATTMVTSRRTPPFPSISLPARMAIGVCAAAGSATSNRHAPSAPGRDRRCMVGPPAKRCLPGHAASSLQPPPDAPVPHVHGLAEHERAAAHDTLDAKGCARSEERFRDAALAKRPVEPDPLDAAPPALAHHVERVV